MHNTQHLYGISPAEFATLPYTEAIYYKLEAADRLIATLLKPHYTVRDEHRLRDVQSAVKHNRSLLEEIEHYNA